MINLKTIIKMKDLDKLDLCNHLMLNEGAYFFKKGDYVIDNKIVEDVFAIY